LVSNAKKQMIAMFDYSERVLFSTSSKVSSVLALVFLKSFLELSLAHIVFHYQNGSFLLMAQPVSGNCVACRKVHVM